MKKLTLLLLALLACSPKLLADSPNAYLLGVGWLNGESYEVAARTSQLTATVWDPEEDEVPLSPKMAISLAQDGLAKGFPSADRQFHCGDIRLLRVIGIGGKARGHWCYLLQFKRYTFRYSKESEPFATMPVVVYLDGTIELPEQKKANKAPEPTR